MGTNERLQAAINLAQLSNKSQPLSGNALLEKHFGSKKTASSVEKALESLSSNYDHEVTEYEADFWEAEEVEVSDDQEINISIVVKGGKVSVASDY